MFKERYQSMNLEIGPEPGLVEEMARRARAGRRPKGAVRRCAAVAALAVCIGVGVPVAAAHVPGTYELLYAVAPAAAQFFMPVRLVSEDNGIRMEVISVLVEGDTAQVYLSLRDLEGDRVDATTDLNDSYTINRAFDSFGKCERVGYDAETGSACFLISITSMDGQKIDGKKLTFSLRNFISGTELHEGVSIPVDLTGVGEAPAQTTSLVGWSSRDDSVSPERETRVLAPSAPLEGFPVEAMACTGAGYVDGRLHVQIATKDKLQNDNHGWVWLADETGGRLECGYSASFVEGMDTGARVDYTDFVFDLPPEEAGAYQVRGDFFTSSGYTEGRWRVTFPLEEG